jgi:thymidylate synthase (FAD)
MIRKKGGMTMGRCVVSEAEEILDKEFPVLDKGFVRLVDYLGGDQRIVQAARVSYGEGTKTFRQDRGLIQYLMRNHHTSPFEQVVLTFHAKMPIFVARQWVRHRTARLNEISGRYSVMRDEFYLPPEEGIAFQSEDNKQGRSHQVFDTTAAGSIRTRMEQEQNRSYRHYSDLIGQGVARELSRINLPLSLYTEWYWQIDLHNLFHFLALRLDPHAQFEIRSYAEVMLSMTRAVAPVACEAFEEHVLGSTTFSRTEWSVVRDIISTGRDALPDPLETLAEQRGLSRREIERLIQKLDAPDRQSLEPTPETHP